MANLVTTRTEDCEKIYWYDLTEKEKLELDYYETEEEQKDFAGFRFIDWIFDLSDFMKVQKDGELSKLGYHGHKGLGYYSGIAIKISDCGDGVTASYMYWD